MHLDKFDEAIPTLGYFNDRNGTPNWQIAATRIDFIDMTYVTKGQATYIINGEKIIVADGDLICVPKGSTRSARSAESSRFECFAANFQLHTMNGEEIDMPLPLVSKVGIYGDIISDYRRLNEHWLSRTNGYVMRARAQFMLVLQKFMAILVYDVDTYKFDSRVKKAIRYITDNYAEPLTIATVSEFVSLNPVYFGMLFKRETRVTFRDYLNTIRLNQAEDMLRARKLNVTEVAQSCGFSDVFYFSRLFKKYKGVPPSTIQA